MFFCPICKSEFSNNFKICDECRVELVEKPLLARPTVEDLDSPFDLEGNFDKEELEYMEWQAIYPVHDDVFGSAIETLLKSAEIPVRVDRLYGGDIFWRLELGSQGFDKYVFVPKDDAQRGYDLIREYLESIEP